MKVLSIKYQFCASVDPVTYDSFDIKGARSLEAMVQTHLASGSPYLKLYVQFSSPNDAFGTSTFTAGGEEYMPPAPHSISGWCFGRSSQDEFRNNSYLNTTDGEGGSQNYSVVIIANIRSQLRYTPSYRKAWIAKQKALEKIYGGWDASHNKLWQWCQMLERYVTGCIIDLQTEPAYYNDRLLRGCQVFKSLFWSFKQYRDAFPYCKPLVQIDGTFMYGYSSTIASCGTGWLSRHVCPQPNICVISDRGTGILAAIARQGSMWHRTHHRYCLRHVASNYYRKFHSTTEKRQVTNMGYEISKNFFHEMLAILRSVNEEGANYLCNIPFEQWTQAYDNGL
ncbi:hypothetical protein J1N35_034613 [Gossypium stocksii]|uniref:MULE transposase domain-containing protein n=1 Tax=Gossypium stocksii TaxID=47602 RepID=A0A9D3USG0_9ROSI|nr:hypothetical protein J1N35_034613 [Gossypium stocksii]